MDTNDVIELVCDWLVVNIKDCLTLRIIPSANYPKQCQTFIKSFINLQDEFPCRGGDYLLSIYPIKVKEVQ